MIRSIRVCIVLTVLALAAFPASAGPRAEASAHASRPQAAMAEHARTCRHYQNRARFKPRGPGAPLEGRLADNCAAALTILRQGPEVTEARSARARLYMQRLTRLKAAVIDINRDRIYGPDPGRLAQPLTGPDRRIGRGALVTPTGEYLIARHMGVLDALEAWSAGEAMVKASAAEPERPAGSVPQAVQPAEQPDG
ncbi:MAG: hypothetical protein AAF763_14235 [Pseudomonadota bacterium]